MQNIFCFFIRILLHFLSFKSICLVFVFNSLFKNLADILFGIYMKEVSLVLIE